VRSNTYRELALRIKKLGEVLRACGQDETMCEDLSAGELDGDVGQILDIEEGGNIDAGKHLDGEMW
jgi:hypothetical protein